MTFGDDKAFAITVQWEIDWKRKIGKLRVKHKECEMKDATGTWTLLPVGNEPLFDSHVDNVSVLRRLELMARMYKFSIARLCDYIANARSIRPKHLEQFVDIPSYVVKQIINYCVEKKLLAFRTGGYVKSLLFVNALAEFKMALEGERKTFSMLAERMTDVAAEGDPSMEEYANLEEANIMFSDAIIEAQETPLLKKKVKEVYIAKLRRWQREAMKIKRQRLEEQGVSEVKIALLLGKDEDAFEEKISGKTQKKKKAASVNNHTIKEDEDDNVSPPLIKDDGFRLKDEEIERRRQDKKRRRQLLRR